VLLVGDDGVGAIGNRVAAIGAFVLPRRGRCRTASGASPLAEPLVRHDCADGVGGRPAAPVAVEPAAVRNRGRRGRARGRTETEPGAPPVALVGVDLGEGVAGRAAPHFALPLPPVGRARGRRRPFGTAADVAPAAGFLVVYDLADGVADGPAAFLAVVRPLVRKLRSRRRRVRPSVPAERAVFLVGLELRAVVRLKTAPLVAFELERKEGHDGPKVKSSENQAIK